MKKLYWFECGLYLSVILTSAFRLVFTQVPCRTLEFKGSDIYKNSALTTNIIRTLHVRDEGLCKIACYGDNRCKSFNLGPSQGEMNEQRVCELSSSRDTSHPDQLVARPGFTYHPSVSPCSPPCAENQTCEPDNGGYSCFCIHPGFTGDACAEDIDECAFNTHDCANEANCSNNEGSFTCTCPDGFQGDGKSCQDVDECSLGTYSCPVNATCENTIGSYTCPCPANKVLVGNVCLVAYHWIRNEIDSRLNLQGAATFVQEDGRTVLYLDGASTTFAETPAVPIRQTDFTIAVWIKLVSLATRQIIYADWTAPHQFWFRVHSDGRLMFTARRDVDADEPVIAISTAAGDVQTNVWTHVAMTWTRTDGTARLFINGGKKTEEVATANPILDFKNSGHTVYDIGYKRDERETAHGYYSDLMVFNLELSQSEIRNDLVISHPFYNFI